MKDDEGKIELAPPKRELTEEQLNARELLGVIGSLMYGERGQTALGRRMAQFADRPVSQVLVNHWLSGRLPVNTWGLEALLRVAEDAVGGLRMRANLIEGNLIPSLKKMIADRQPGGPEESRENP